MTCEQIPHDSRVGAGADPLLPDIWEAALGAHPDRAYVTYIVLELCKGFRVGFKWDTPLKSATCNMHSTTLRPATISEYIDSELAKNHMLSPFPLAWRHFLHINRFGLITKGHGTGKFRLITDLSYPHGASVNDGIDPALTSLSYTSVDSVAQRVQQLGKGLSFGKNRHRVRISPRPPYTHKTGFYRPWSGRGRSMLTPCFRLD